MKLEQIKINNVTSFIDFQNNSNFKFENLIFGTNGSGKSTLLGLLHVIDRYKQDQTAQKEQLVKEYFRKRISKENPDSDSVVEFAYSAGKQVVTYNPKANQLNFSTENWIPIKVFNDTYTELNIGDEINVDLPDNGIVFGEKHKDIAELESQKKSLTEKCKDDKEKFTAVVEETIKKFKDITDSSAKIEKIINLENLLSDTCVYKEDETLIKQRHDLGTGEPELPPDNIPEVNFQLGFDVDEIEKICGTKFLQPHISKDLESLLKEFSSFYTTGIEVYDFKKDGKCPFCSQFWESADERIQVYKDFLESRYNRMREAINVYKQKIENYKVNVNNYKTVHEKIFKQVKKQSEKYRIEVNSWIDIVYDDDKHNEIISILNNKFNNMDF